MNAMAEPLQTLADAMPAPLMLHRPSRIIQIGRLLQKCPFIIIGVEKFWVH